MAFSRRALCRPRKKAGRQANIAKRSNIRKIELRFAVAALVSGLTLTQAQYFIPIMGNKTPLPKAVKFYQVQEMVSQIIIGYTQKNVEKYRNLMSNSLS